LRSLCLHSYRNRTTEAHCHFSSNGRLHQSFFQHRFGNEVRCYWSRMGNLDRGCGSSVGKHLLQPAESPRYHSLFPASLCSRCDSSTRVVWNSCLPRIACNRPLSIRGLRGHYAGLVAIILCLCNCHDQNEFQGSSNRLARRGDRAKQ
jgi:hypothetical protein